MARKKVKKRGPRRVRRDVPVAQAHIQSTFNNTIIT
ncbi:MAG TPA: 30S ribosomal protein S11, partial [Anaerolineae bacterium]|nr:30S ribosomal protein S11 [Anaerolineae bacterium]